MQSNWIWQNCRISHSHYGRLSSERRLWYWGTELPPKVSQFPSLTYLLFKLLVIVPTRELAVQVYNESRKYGYMTPITSIAVYGGTSVAAQRNQLKLGKTIVAATLGRLKQFIEEV